MCGILGYWSTRSRESLDWFGVALAELSDRGPDGSGQEVLHDGNLALGHTRLSIIDTSILGRQPLSNEDGRVWITFNGEIYNFKDLRKELLDFGHLFKSSTDTEVIVHAYEQWGQECVTRLKGIFAFAVWDQEKELLFLARDHVGVKPLYFATRPGSFTFASQPKAILANPSFVPEVCPEAFRDYLAFGYVPEPACIYRGIEKLPPGHCLEVTRDAILKTRYWELKYQPSISNFRDASEAIGSTVAKCVETQLVSDVPVGALLSGGIDSTFVTGIASKQSCATFGPFRTFTLGFDDVDSDERQYAKIASDHFKTQHFVDELVLEDLPRQLEEVICSFDEPFDPNGPLPATRIAQLVRRNNTKVVLGGDGGDELFAGYLRYDKFNAFRNRKLGLWQRLSCYFGKSSQSLDDVVEYFKHEGACNTHLLAELFPERFSSDWLTESLSGMISIYDKSLPAVTSCQLIDFNHYLPGHILTKVDRATMHYGVEARVPLLDVELAELAFRIDVNVNYRNRERKAALKAAAADYLPSQLMSGRKKGFSSPMNKWLTPRIRAWAKEKIENGMLVAMGLVRRDAAQRLIGQPTYHRFRAFWLLLSAELWAERWLVKDTNRLAIPEQLQGFSRV